MPSISASLTTAPYVIPRLKQKVYISGILRKDVYCTQINRKLGVAGSACALVAPKELWDTTEEFKGKKVSVWVGYGDSTMVPQFHGVINVVDRDIATNSIGLECVSWLGFADKCFVGQGIYDGNVRTDNYADNGLRVIYKKSQGWTPTLVLRDIFGATITPVGAISADWRALLKLGSLADFATVDVDTSFGAFEFNRANLKDAIQQILDKVGNVNCYEVFNTDGSTTIEFMSDGMRPIDALQPVTITVAKANEAVGLSNILSINHNENYENTISRVIAFGDYRKFMVSLWDEPYAAASGYIPPSDQYGDGSELTDPTKFVGLRRGWNPDLQEIVIANPDVQDETNAQYTTEIDKVYKRYYLPQWFDELVIENENLVQLQELGDEEKITNLDVQVWGIHPYIMPYPSGVTNAMTPSGAYPYSDIDYQTLCAAFPDYSGSFAGNIPPGSFISCTHPVPSGTPNYNVPIPSGWEGFPRLIKGVDLHLNEGFFILEKPAIQLYAATINPSGKKPLEAYEALRVGITFTYRGRRISADTGVIGPFNVDGIDTGLIETFTNDNFKYEQITNWDYPLTFLDETGAVTHSLEYPTTIYFNEDTIYYANALQDGATVVNDDTVALQTLALKALNEKQRPQETYNITLPFYSNAFRVGQYINIEGEDSFVYGTHMIRHVLYNLTDDHSVTLDTDNNVPLYASNLLEKGVAADQPVEGNNPSQALPLNQRIANKVVDFVKDPVNEVAKLLGFGGT